MYVLMLAQMLYVLTGNDVHEWLGIAFFVCLLIHLYLKRRWFSAVLKRKNAQPSRRFADAVIVLLTICLLVLAVSSMGVSRTLFPDLHFLGTPALHSLLAALALTLAVIHGGMHFWFSSKKRKKTAALIAVCALAALGIGLGAVPYMDRHLKKVDIRYAEKVHGDPVPNNGTKPLVVYFTRLGNTDFGPDPDAVSGASLLIADGSLMGNTQLMADMLKDMLGCETAAITLTGERYPASYSATCAVAGKELKSHIRPAIAPIDLSSADSVILVYPIWWGTIPMPVETFLMENDFSGKTVYLVATQGSNGFASSTKDVKKLVPGAEVKEALSIYCGDIPDARSMLYTWALGTFSG